MDRNKDNDESGSLTPGIRRDHINRKIFLFNRQELKHVKAYSYGNEGEPGSILKRFAIDSYSIADLIKNPLGKYTLHFIEEQIFELAFEELKIRPVVLVDVFKRSGRAANSPHPETHTVCLWAYKEDAFLIIDPNNAEFTDFIPKALGSRNLEMWEHSTPKTKFVTRKFYSTNVINPIGRGKSDKRDCIDISVKIAFQIIQSRGLDYETIKNEINKLSNQSVVNRGILGGADGTILRELQSSNLDNRKRGIQLLQDNKEYTDSIIVHTLEDLEELQVCSEANKDEFKFKLESIKNFGKMRLCKIDSLMQLLSETRDELVKLGFPSLKPQFIKDIKNPEIPSILQRNLFKAFYDSNTEAEEIIHFFTHYPDIIKNIAGCADENGHTLLQLATCKNFTYIAKTLVGIMNNDDIAKIVGDGRKFTVLHLAVIKNNLEIIEALVDKNIAGLVEAKDEYGRRALHLAAEQGHVRIVQCLVEKGNIIKKHNYHILVKSNLHSL
jgi:hypothetical protein